MSNNSTKHIVWIDILRGLSIILVVMWHVSLIDLATGINHVECAQIASYFKPLRMPTFIFLSGGMLYLSRIAKNWSTKELYKDKIKRLLLPLVFFIIIYSFWDFAADCFSNSNPEYITFSHYFQHLYKYQGVAVHLWFIATLCWFMLLYPLYKLACKSHILLLILLITTLLLSVFNPIDLPQFFGLHKATLYLFYFLLGITCFRYELYKWLSDNWLTLSSICLYIASWFFTHDSFLQTIIGIVMMVSIAMKLAKYKPSLFSHFKSYTYQIYLMSIIFQTLVGIVLWYHLFYNEYLFWVFYLVSILSGIYLPVFIAKLIEKSNFTFLRLCFGLK
ncbi:MAG: acyltransferase family protein [Muribaculaceae bacterium]